MYATIIFTIADKTFSVLELNERIDKIYRCISNVYVDLTDAFFMSAKNSIEVASTSKNPQLEFMSAIHHLYNAHSTFVKLLTAKKEISSFWGTKYVDQYENKHEIHYSCAELAYEIYRLYTLIGEDDSAAFWIKKCAASVIEIKNYYNSCIEEYTSRSAPRKGKDDVSPTIQKLKKDENEMNSIRKAIKEARDSFH